MILLITFSLLAGLTIIYVWIIRPWQLQWGATETEVHLSLPGDHLVLNPDFNGTRAITIHASEKIIWRWLIQIGSKRAGWYSLDWIDNAGIKSSNEILSAFQKIEVGQFIPFTPDQKNGMWVSEFKENEYILWVDKDGKGTWLWKLIPSGDGNTRLLTRLRTQYNWKGLWIIYYLLYDVGDIIMMSRCLKGIKRRAERESHQLKTI
jgi:hypothetical protein